MEGQAIQALDCLEMQYKQELLATFKDPPPEEKGTKGEEEEVVVEEEVNFESII